MGFQVSPGVNITEKDATTIVPAVGTTDGAYAGVFQWGPVMDPVLVGDELELVSTFGKPNAETASSFFTCANFLAYTNKLRIVRVVNSEAKNAVAKLNEVSGESVLIRNDDDYNNLYGAEASDEGITDDDAKFGPFVAKHPGALGNGLRVSVCPAAKAFRQTLTGTLTGTAGSKTISGNGTKFDKELSLGSVILVNEMELSVASIVDADTLTVTTALTSTLSNASAQAEWEYAATIGAAPGTSLAAKAAAKSVGKSGSDLLLNDELHIVVIDQLGKFSGQKGEVLERFAYVSKAKDAKNEDGTSNFYKNVINRRSRYVRWADHIDEVAANWGKTLVNANTKATIQFGPLSGDEDTRPFTYDLTGGVDSNVDLPGNLITGERMMGYDLFKNAEKIDVYLVLLGEASAPLAQYVVQNICETRKDAVAFISPDRESCVGRSDGAEEEKVIEFRDALNMSSSYAFMDSGWKYQYDKYNDVERWVPLNGDIAGLTAATETSNDAWWSPAGYNRGKIKNVIKLAWNPYKAERDDLYIAGVNPVISVQGTGTVLFGDKTLLDRPSAFDRINVRRLFIILEKAIATFAKFSLFEFNDEFTRQSFRSKVEPFLRDVQARRGIYDFKVVCDRTNNPGSVIDRNEFVGDIYIKPARSINFIQLNFIAVGTGTDFSEIVGKI